MSPFRLIRRARGYAVTILGMLAIGTAILVTAFSHIDAALFRPPPFPAVDRLFLAYNIRISPRGTDDRVRWSYRSIQMLRRGASDVAEVANYSAALLTLSREGEAESLHGEVASPGYFPILGVTPLLGRFFLPEEDSIPGERPVVILGERLWRRAFGADSGVLGRVLRINGQSLVVVGVARPGFQGLSGTADLWIPTVMAPVLTYPQYLTSNQHFISAVARLRDGVPVTRFTARLEAIGRELQRALPDSEAGQARDGGVIGLPLNQARITRTTRQSFTLLLAGAALLYLLAVANVVNLMLSRSFSRRREAAIMVAIGASTWRRLLHFGSEGVLLAVPACLAGIGVAWLISPLIGVPMDNWGPRTLYGNLSPFAEPVFDARVLWFGLGVTVLTAALIVWAPVVSLINPPVSSMLRGGAGVSRGAGSLRRPSLRGAVVAAETALAVLLLVAGGLLVQSFFRMLRTDLGVDSNRVLTFWIRPSESRVPPERAPEFVSRVLSALSAVPGVEAVTVDGGAPVSGSANSTLFVASNPPASPADAPPVLRHYVAPDHFKVLGIPVLRGRTFEAGDIAGRPRVAVISQSAARRFWPGRDPIGDRVWFGGGSTFDSPETSAEIVGIVGDVAYQPLDAGDNRADFYTPYQQFTYASRNVLVRTSGEPTEVIPGLRRAIAQVDPDLPMVELQTLNQRIGDSWARQRFEAVIFGGLALVALLLAASGVYSVVSFAVRQRTQEMGIRLALGARPAAIVRLVIGQGMIFPVAGLIAGAIGAVGVARFLRSSLYQVAPGDPRVPATALGVLLIVAILACYVPARRATEVDPAGTLRAE